MAGKIWSEEDDMKIKSLYGCTPTKDLSVIIGRSEIAIYNRAHIFGLKKEDAYLKSPESGRLMKGQTRSPGTCFKKGNISANKGKKQSEYMSNEAIGRTKATRFNKGHLPHNTKANLDISIRHDKTGAKYQYIRVAVAKWIPLHRFNWEKINGPIPPKMKLIFKDRNTMNCEIDNLELVTPGQLMKRNSVHNYPKPLVQVIQLRGTLNRQINKHLKNTKHEK